MGMRTEQQNDRLDRLEKKLDLLLDKYGLKLEETSSQSEPDGDFQSFERKETSETKTPATRVTSTKLQK